MNLKFITLILFAFFIGVSQTVFSQQSEKENKVYIPRFEYSGYMGALIAHHEEMKSMAQHPYLGQEISLGWQSTGKKYWQEVFNYPIIGLGAYSGAYNTSVIGNPFAFFGFIEIPFSRKEKSYFSASWGGGMAFHINEYDSITNPQNIAIGTDINVFINFGFSYKYRVSDRMELGAGIKLQHFSNGAIRHPNLGLNMASAQITLNYLLKPFDHQFEKTEPELPEKKYEWNLMYGIGINGKSQAEPDVKYLNHTLSMGVSRRMNFKRTLGVGMDVFYNEGLVDEYLADSKLTMSDYVSYAGYLSSDMIMNKFRLAVQLGFYLYRPVDYSIPFYERVAVRYYVLPNIFANISIKAHAAKAQFFEWGMGVSF